MTHFPLGLSQLQLTLHFFQSFSSCKSFRCFSSSFFSFSIRASWRATSLSFLFLRISSAAASSLKRTSLTSPLKSSNSKSPHIDFIRFFFGCSKSSPPLFSVTGSS
eukprot:Lithocolla_globosa_v1_NODE_257_length_4779_cov_60.829103.p9 type:complete len:106 gc:universal NODE_257_length_4779_cov_60.829103:3654-3337(-)